MRKKRQASADRGDYLLVLADYEATIVDGTPVVPQADASVTQYVEWRYAADPAVLVEAAARGSLCAQIFLEDNSKKRGARDAEVGRVAELVASSDALERVRGEARALVESAVQELETIELDGLRPMLIGLAHSAVDRVS